MMIHGSSIRADPLTLAADVFVSLAYGAAIHLIMHHAINESALLVPTLLLALASVLFLLCDWSSRTLVPKRTGRSFSPQSILGKLTLEVTGVFFMAASACAFMHSDAHTTLQWLPTHLNPFTAFAAFLVATWVWDMFLVFELPDLGSGLVKALLYGDALERAPKHYLGLFSKRLAARSKAMDALWHSPGGEPVAGSQPVERDTLAVRHLRNRRLLRCLESLAATFITFFVHHLAYANALGAVSLFLCEYLRRTQPILSLPPLFRSHVLLFVVIALGALGVVFVFSQPVAAGERMRFRRLAGPAGATLAVAFGLWHTLTMWPRTIILNAKATTNVVLGGAVVVFMLYLLAAYRERWPWIKTLASAMVLLVMVVAYLSAALPVLVLLVMLQQVIVTIFLLRNVAPLDEHAPLSRESVDDRSSDHCS